MLQPWHRSPILAGWPIAFRSSKGSRWGAEAISKRKRDGVVISVSVGGATTYIASGEINAPPFALES
jgi:hypothetical protein